MCTCVRSARHFARRLYRVAKTSGDVLASGGGRVLVECEGANSPRRNQMAMKMTAKELLHAKELESLGIPLDGEVLEKFLDAYRGLWIGQDPISIHTELFDLASGGTGVSIGLTVWNESSRIIRLKAAGLEIWWCNQIRLLGDPV